jgi:hypothetical protein
MIFSNTILRSFVQPEATMKARILAKQKHIYLGDLDIIEQLIGDLFFDTIAEDCEDGDCGWSFKHCC